MENLTNLEITFDILRFQQLKETKIFDNTENIKGQNPFVISAVIEMLIRLRDLLYKSEKLAGHRVNFRNDVVVTETIKDVTDLIIYARNAVCHIDSENNTLYGSNVAYSSLSIIIGKGTLHKDLPPSDYDDDIAIIFGKERVYYKRHMLRAFYETIENLLPLTGIYKDTIDSILRNEDR